MEIKMPNEVGDYHYRYPEALCHQPAILRIDFENEEIDVTWRTMDDAIPEPVFNHRSYEFGFDSRMKISVVRKMIKYAKQVCEKILSNDGYQRVREKGMLTREAQEDMDNLENYVNSLQYNYENLDSRLAY